MVPSKRPDLYRLKHTGGIYEITYQAASGAHLKGIPHDDLTDLVNLRLAIGKNSPPFIVTSLADFRASFVQVDLLSDDTDEAEPQNPKE